MTTTLTIAPDDNVWRATVGEHSAAAADGFTAAHLVLWRAEEAGLALAEPAPEPGPGPSPTPPVATPDLPPAGPEHA